MTSSIASKDIKDEDPSFPTISTKIIMNKNIIDSFMQESTSNDDLVSIKKMKIKKNCN